MRSPALPALRGVILIPPPTPDQWLAITVTLGALSEGVAAQTRFGDAGVDCELLAELGLRDGRRVWVGWYKVPLSKWPLPQQGEVPAKRQQFAPDAGTAAAAGRSVAVYAGDVWADGSFVFYRMSL